MGTRNPNRASSIYFGANGNWHGRVTVGYRDDGSLDRRHVESKSKATVVARVRQLERDRDNANVRRIGQRWTVESWLQHWLENIAEPSIRESSFSAYRIAVNKHLIPGLGKHRLERLEPEHLEKLYRKMIMSGARPGTAHQVHRTIRTALGEAHRRGHVSRNVAALAKPPRVQVEPVRPYSVDEVQRILEAAMQRPNGARWAIALALGLRQGEAAGLRWADIDLETRSLRIRGTRPRPVYGHGCGGTCGRKAGFCPKHMRLNPEVGDAKSQAGRRVVGLPDELVQLLVAHRSVQHEQRTKARQLWQEGGWVFTSALGKPLSLNSDYREWKALLQSAGVPDGRLHDARHTAATVLLVLGVPERTVMSVMGWSSTAMAARYQHVTDPIRRDVADRIGGLLWAERKGADDAN
jgi:integrase